MNIATPMLAEGQVRIVRIVRIAAVGGDGARDRGIRGSRSRTSSQRLRTRLACSIGFVLCVPLQARTIFVDGAATGANTGASWRDAATSLSEALRRASAGDKVWVTAGEYGAITLKDGVKLFGGL